MAVYIFDRSVKNMLNRTGDMQIYQEQLSEKTSAQIKLIFTEIPEQKEIYNYRSLGISAGQLLGMHQYLTDNRGMESCMKAEDKLEELKNVLHCTEVNFRDTEIQLIQGGYVIASILLDEGDRDYFWAVLYYSCAKLLRMEVYTDGIAYLNTYVTAASEQGLYAKLVRRTFYNQDSSVAYDQIFEGEKEWFLFPDGRACTKPQVMEEFIKRLNLSEQDTILLDAFVPNACMQAVFAFGKTARIVALAHVGHDFMKRESSGGAFSRGYYYDWFPYIEMIDAMVVPTKEQKAVLIKELETYHCKVPDVKVAPIDGEFHSLVLYESYDENLALSWGFHGRADGFWIYDESGKRICETRNMQQHSFLIKGYQKDTGFVLKAFVDTLKGKMVAAESGTVYVSARKSIHVMGMQDTLKYVRNRRISIARFGDGEIDLMTGHSIPYQDYEERLAKRLKEIVTMPDNDKLLVCLPDVFERIERYNDACRSFWKQHLERYQDFYAQIVTDEKHYGSTFISRPYIDLVDKSVSGKHFQNMKEFFANKDILIVEGLYSRSGVGNDLFQKAKSVERIICPSRNAFGKYETILDVVRQHGLGKLILLMLGPTAKVLARDLAFEGYWAVDIGHIDSEYEWYKRGVTHKTKLKNKHTAEFNFDEHIELQNDEKYDKEIVAMLPD